MPRGHQINPDANYRTRLGVGVLVTYAGMMVLTAIVFGSIGVSSYYLSARAGASAEEKERVGKLLVRADDKGRCRQYSFDNRTQQIVDAGIVSCRDSLLERFRGRTSADVIREAFGGR